VLAVMLHNCGAPGFQGGFLGVDIFFALSGFLITTLLLEDHVRRGTIALAAFFWRRVLRLYPALVVLIAAVALSSLARPEVDASRVWLVVVSNLFYFSNWVLAADTRAWAGGTAHTWSLAVEVHFYVGVGAAARVRHTPVGSGQPAPAGLGRRHSPWPRPFGESWSGTEGPEWPGPTRAPTPAAMRSFSGRRRRCCAGNGSTAPAKPVGRRCRARWCGGSSWPQPP
jgi:hypothetical protein